MPAITVPPPRTGRDTRARRDARAALIDVLWDARGRRRLPRERELANAIDACAPGDLWWVCEANSGGPLYLLPTREWLTALARFVDDTGARKVLEIGAGDGFLSTILQRRRPRLSVRAVDDFSWTKASRRMTAADRREFAGIEFSGIQPSALVERAPAVATIEAWQPDLVIASWAPPGTLVERAIRASTRLVLDLSVDGDVCGNGDKTWRFEKEFLDGALEDRALCRLDDEPHAARATRATLYFGRLHEQHAVTPRRRRAGLDGVDD
ncbi:MAG: hypothetical protein FJ137_20535 [Deltaproteobacteria bacterium]|nr:hypothetical protein [Deltaproteobacteria bacterium]